jgi:hypothetical protein
MECTLEEAWYAVAGARFRAGDEAGADRALRNALIAKWADEAAQRPRRNNYGVWL